MKRWRVMYRTRNAHLLSVEKFVWKGHIQAYRKNKITTTRAIPKQRYANYKKQRGSVSTADALLRSNTKKIRSENVPVLIPKSSTTRQHENKPKIILNLRRNEALDQYSANGFECLLNVKYVIIRSDYQKPCDFSNFCIELPGWNLQNLIQVLFSEPM